MLTTLKWYLICIATTRTTTFFNKLVTKTVSVTAKAALLLGGSGIENSKQNKKYKKK